MSRQFRGPFHHWRYERYCRRFAKRWAKQKAAYEWAVKINISKTN